MSLTNTYLDGIKNNDSEVIRQIYTNFSPIIVKYILENSGTVNDAKDVIQDAMIVIFKKIGNDNLVLTSSFQTYLFGVCRFIWLRKIKKNKREVITSAIKDTLTVNDEWEEELIASRKLLLFRSKLSLLSAECRALLNYSFNGLSGKEIANKMNYTVEFVKRKRFRCKKSLTNAIKDDPEYHILNQEDI